MKIQALNKLSSLQVFQVFRYGAPFVISVILVRLLSQQSIGIYESLTLIGSSFTFFWVTGIINAFIPYYYSIDEEKRPLLIFNVFILLFSLSVLCFAILAVLKPVLFNPGLMFQGASWSRIYYYFLAYNLFNAPAFLMEYLLLVKNKSKTIIAYGALISIVQILALTVPVSLGYGLESGVILLAILSFLKFMALSLFVLRISKVELSRNIFIAFGMKALPAVLTLLVGGSMPHIDSYIALHFVDRAKFAIYRYGAQEMPLVMLMANALSNVYSGDIAHANLDNNIHISLQKLKASSARLMHSLFPFTILLILFSRFLFTHIYSDSFAGSSAIFSVFMLLTISRLIFPQTIMQALLKNNALLKFGIVEWVVNFILDFVFFYKFGLIGIAYATVFAYFLERAIQIIYLARLGYNPGTYIPLKIWMLYGLLTIGVWVIMAI